MMRHLLLVLLGAFLVLAQSWIAGLGHMVAHLLALVGFTLPRAWAELGGLSPSLTVPFVMFLGVSDGKTAGGAVVTFITGYLLDLAAGAPVGLFTFAHVAVFALARSFGVRVVTQTTLALGVLALFVTALHSGVVLGLLAIFGRDTWIPRTLIRFIPPRAIVSALFSPLVFAAARRVQAMVYARSSVRAPVRRSEPG